MIPKKIHYCWFGYGQKPKLAAKCMESWRKYCPDYELIEWNENNFTINCNRYVKQAYEKKKYAFITDYVRLHALYYHGGIYMDTDVEVVKPLNVFLQHNAFSGFESPAHVPTGIMACEKKFPLFKELLDYYESKEFINASGEMDMTTNVHIITNTLEKYGLIKDGSLQVVHNFVLYPRDYFCPLDDATGVLYKSSNTHTIHWFSKSWIEPKYRIRSKITRIFHRAFGKDCFAWVHRK
ncbi:hypothetical protein SPSIL_010470 [Sporomusa silvacetica DSM 10669]|uniref:Glycosyltransferase sugar-binding region containing DXD motif protein n=1 Tax=Sporomusa silvacetica DSM 10669 TaxID=1123289 RepID=A0ABZ3IHT2_9FIRM|nr:glycosyltransferase [Sporomusa silvacetica]OZC21439.1 glycosyltransferase sugar-binding region containing DXD motif protein [Sporomusa silvacetica DSM 10669]